ncbi:retrotransposon protein, putative, ty1-copia subclass [Tanacetum coccineum]
MKLSMKKLEILKRSGEHELKDHGEPTNYRAALSDPESDKWLEAMNAEMQSMKDNQVWNLVDLPPNCKTVRSKWLFKKRSDMDGNMRTYKARLIAKGFTQTYGVDYEKTFSPVVDVKAIRILIAIAVFYDYKIWQMDVKTAFLNGLLNEDVYMVQPEGFDEEIKRYGFTQNLNEPCVYVRASGSIVIFLILYVDDILLMGKNSSMLQDVKYWLGKCFAMKGLDLSKTQGPFTPAEMKRMKGVPYASAVGSIMYAVRCTRPDVAFS